MAAPTQVFHSIEKRYVVLPFSGAGANVPAGTIVMPGVTGGTNYGVSIPITATSNARAIGVLAEKHVFATTGDSTTATLVNWFPEFTATPPSKKVELGMTSVLLSVDYSLVSTVAVASASGATLTITSFEGNFDGGYVYVNAGTGIGQLLFVASSSSGSCVLTSAATTQLDATSKLTKVLPYFYETPVWLINTTTATTLLDSTAAAGTGRAACLGQFLVKNGNVKPIDPLAHHNTSGYNSASQFRLYSLMALQNTIFTRNA